ncbi:MAG TPA: hypothetical protein DCL44_05120 [Elusimicrobia bacterium]|nr:hypothetical protein [Elusimicrobiota bacterium]
MSDIYGKTYITDGLKTGLMVISATACIFLTAVPCFAQAARRPEQSGQLNNMVIEGETRIQVKGDKPAEASELDPKEYVDKFIVSYVRENNPAEKLSVSYSLYLPSQLTSDAVLSPWRGRLIEPPVLSLLVKTPPGVNVANWRLVIANDQGKVFRIMKGKGNPPANIVWDGMDDSGEPLLVGHPYAYSLAVLDKFDVPTYLFGKSVTVRGLVLKNSGRLNIIIDTAALFEKGLKFSTNGYVYARETQDRLRKFLDRDITIRVYGNDADLAQREADIIKDFLEDSLHLNKGTIAAKGQPAGKSNYQRTEITADKS